MVEALLLTKNITASTHKGVITLFGEHFIKTGIIKKELGRALRRAYDLRQKGDYSTGFTVNKREAKEILMVAKEFFTEIEKNLENLDSVK